MSARVKVWFHRSRAIVWGVLGVISFALGWQNSVALVWAASLYANISTDWGAAEAADDRELLVELQRIRQAQRGSRSHWPKRLREQGRSQ